MIPIIPKTRNFSKNKNIMIQYNSIETLIRKIALLISLSVAALVISCSTPTYTLEPATGIPVIQTRTEKL